MNRLQVGSIVTRKSYGGDVHFKITNIITNDDGKPVYVLKGLLYRLEADSSGDDLLFQDLMTANRQMRSEILKIRSLEHNRINTFTRFIFSRLTGRSGRILHLDGDSDFLKKCIDFYRKAGLKSFGKAVSESRQPEVIGRYLEIYRPDIVVVTGHDGIKKDSGDTLSLNGYRNSRYFVKSAEIARKYQPDFNKLCIFAGACQSYFEAIMKAGTNFASSPGRILINYLDPATVGKRIALTDSKSIVTPQEIAEITVSGGKGIGGINTRGHLTFA